MIFFNKKKKIAAKELQSLEDKLQTLRLTIQMKRERAREAFEKILIAIERTKGIEGLEHLSGKLAELGQVFTEGKKTLAEKPEKEIVAFEKTEAELAIEDIFEAMESLVNAREHKEKLKAAMLKEELKRMMILRYANAKNHPGDWTKTVTSGDLVELLQKSEFNVITQHFESPQLLLDESIRLAQESVSMRDLKAFVSHQGADAKGLNVSQASKSTGQGI